MNIISHYLDRLPVGTIVGGFVQEDVSNHNPVVVFNYDPAVISNQDLAVASNHNLAVVSNYDPAVVSNHNPAVINKSAAVSTKYMGVLLFLLRG